MLSYTLGSFLAFLPKRWRESLPFHASVDWKPAVLLSGILECLIALIALIYWYSYSVTHWAADAVFSAIQNGAEINPNAIGFAGLAVTFLHPLTWLIAYFGFEGIVRLCAAFTDTTLGVLPLYLLDKACLQFRRGGNPLSDGADNFSQSHLASGIRAVRERALMATLPSPCARGILLRTVYCSPWRATELQRAAVNPCARSASGCVRPENQREDEVARLRKKPPPNH